MIDNFNIFGGYHLISLLIPVLIITLFIYIAKKYDVKRSSIILAIVIILIRSVRYVFDISIDEFKLIDLVSMHICHIDLFVLLICLFKPNRKLFVFTFLIGIPTALAVALFPGRIHPEPGLIRAIFFIMSHTMLVMGSIYLLIVYKFEIKKSDLKLYYLISLIGIIVIYFVNILLNTNYMYLVTAPAGTVLESLSNATGSFYVLSIYLILTSLFSLLYGIYLIIKRIV